MDEMMSSSLLILKPKDDIFIVNFGGDFQGHRGKLGTQQPSLTYNES